MWVSHFIPKPSDPETIVGTVGEALGSSRVLPLDLVSQHFDSEELRLLNARLVEQVGQLDAANADRRKLLGQLVHAHEEERERIAEGLHDDSVQAVVALRNASGDASCAYCSTRVGTRAGGSRDAAAEAVERLRSLLVGIQPINLEKNRVSVALGVFLEQAGVEDGLECHLACMTPPAGPAWPSGRFSIGWGVRRSRCCKHAHASSLTLELRERRRRVLP